MEYESWYGEYAGEQDVYCGSDDDYFSIGSISAGERVSVLGRDERGWLYVEFNTPGATTTAKRGYVPAESLSMFKSQFTVPKPSSTGLNVT